MEPVVNLQGKVGLVTGLANDKSIAYGVAKACRNAGAELVLSWQNEKTRSYTSAIADELQAGLFEHLDVTQSDSVEALVEAVSTKYGRLDFLVHSMAFAPKDDLHGRVLDSSLDGFSQAMDVSVHSFIRLSKAFEPILSDGGALVTMTYLGSERVVKHYGLMGLCKAALESATRYMADEMGERGVRVFAVSPGPMLTRAASGISHFDSLMKDAVERSPLHRLATPEQVGNLTAFLVSPAAAGMTGATVYVDAGYHIEA